MNTVGIVCEYNPLHLGHRKQMALIRREFGEDSAIVCAMSGNFVQRGMPALMDKTLRAQAAVRCGADLVLELPVPQALSSAEGFAAGGVSLLTPVCDTLCFGTESADGNTLMETARTLLSPAFSQALRAQLDKGLSFPAARQVALEELPGSGDVLRQPNDILAVEYCKAILAQDAKMDIFPIHRQGSYHAQTPDPENPSATSLRQQILGNAPWKRYVPEAAAAVFENAPLHTLEAGERAILAKLRTMSDAEFEALPFGSEGLWRKLMHACRREASLEDILQATKSKRYTRTRLDRMVMCAFLGITREQMEQPAPYIRVLAFTDRGRKLLKEAKKQGIYLNAGEASQDPYWQRECCWGDLYGLFRTDLPEAPGMEQRRRIFYLPDGEADT